MRTKSLFFAFILVTAAIAGAKPVAVTLTFNTDREVPGYLTKADETNLYISQYETGQQASPYPRSSIKGISWREPEDWTAAMDLWNSRDYVKAGTAFGQAMEDYQGLAILEDSIGARAVFYHMECLRRSGRYQAMMAPYLRVQRVNLSAGYKDQIRLFQGWSHLVSKKWKPLSLMMKDYEVKEEEIPGINDYTIAPNELPLQQSMNIHHMAQVAFLRANSTEKLAEGLAADLAQLDPNVEANRADREALSAQIAVMRSQALTDYSRAFTINYGAERGLALRSMLSALRLLKSEPNYAESFSMKKEAHGIATLFNVLSGGKLPAAMKPMLTAPVEPGTEDK